MNYQEMQYHILDSNKYMTLATVDEFGNPWASPVTFVFDEKNFYFISSDLTRHSKNIAKNPKVSFAIFDSLQSSENAFGLQGAGIAKKMTINEVPASIKTALFSLVSIVVLNRDYSFFKIHINEMYLPHIERWKDDKPLRILIM